MGKVPDTIYDKTFRGGWRKFINRRKDVTKVDTTVVTPSGKKLRSNVELLKFLRENPSYLKEINPREVNFDKNPEHARKCSGTVKKFIQNVEELRSEHDLPPLVKCCKYIFIQIRYMQRGCLLRGHGRHEMSKKGSAIKVQKFCLFSISFTFLKIQ